MFVTLVTACISPVTESHEPESRVEGLGFWGSGF